MSIEQLLNSQLYTRKSTNLAKLGFDFSSEPQVEYFKIQSLLYSLYHIRCESMLTIMKLFNIPSSKTMDTLFRIFEIESRSLSDATTNALINGRSTMPNSINSFTSKQCWHTTWDNNKVFLRSTYELNFALELDSKQIHYETECMRIKYFDTQKLKYRIAVPDFYIPSENKIVEIKATYWYDPENMKDKVSSYKDLGFNFQLILDGAPTET